MCEPKRLFGRLRHQPAVGNSSVGSPIELCPPVTLGCEIDPFELFDLDDHCGKVAKPRFLLDRFGDTVFKVSWKAGGGFGGACAWCFLCEVTAATGEWRLCPDFAGNVVFLMDGRKSRPGEAESSARGNK